jgi:hypothetical protein
MESNCEALMSNKDKLIKEIFASPIRSNIKWKDVESLLRQLGAEVTEGSGSRVRISLNGLRAVFHRPHPQKEMDKGAVKDLRELLTKSGISQQNQ